MSLAKHLEEAVAKLEAASERIERARRGPSTPANHQEWLLALTEFTSVLSDIQRLNNESVHEKLHEIAGRVRLKLRSSGSR
jgi:hypothetical protein